MQFPIRLALLSLVAVQAATLEAQATLSFQDTVGSELLTRVNVERDSLGDLGDASTDVDAPEQLHLPGPPKPREPTPAELALLQAKVSAHKEREVSRKQSTRKLSSHKKLFDDAFTTGQVRHKDKPEDVDVDQLGGQLQNLMSQLGAPPVEKEANKGKQVLKRASAMEAEANGDDADLAIEKEAGDVTTSTDTQKDDAANVVDGAMTYIRTRLAAEEHKGLRLRQFLAQSVRENKDMRQKIVQLHTQMAEGGKLQSSLRAATAKKIAQEEADLSKETKRAESATVHLKNATRAAQIGAKAMKFLGMRLKYAKSQVAALLLNLANSTQQNKDLRHQLAAINATEIKKAKLLAESKRVVAVQAKELAESKAKLLQLEAFKKADDSKLVTLDRQKDLLGQRQTSAGKRDKILHKENNLLKKQLSAEIQREEQLREMWSKESEAFTWQLRAERANASESVSDLEKARTEFQDLRGRVQKLKERATEGEKSKSAAEEAANKAQFALSEAEAENKQLKGSVPWLEAEVDRQRKTAQNVTRQAQQALRERDTVKAILAEAQKNIVQLQSQYADALQALVVAQAGGSDKPQQQQQQAPADSIQEFAGLGADPLGAPPPVGSPIGFPQVPGASWGSSLLELRRDSRALNNMMAANQPAPAQRVDLNGVLRGMNNAR